MKNKLNIKKKMNKKNFKIAISLILIYLLITSLFAFSINYSLFNKEIVIEKRIDRVLQKDFSEQAKINLSSLFTSISITGNAPICNEPSCKTKCTGCGTCPYDNMIPVGKGVSICQCTLRGQERDLIYKIFDDDLNKLLADKASLDENDLIDELGPCKCIDKNSITDDKGNCKCIDSVAFMKDATIDGKTSIDYKPAETTPNPDGFGPPEFSKCPNGYIRNGNSLWCYKFIKEKMHYGKCTCPDTNGFKSGEPDKQGYCQCKDGRIRVDDKCICANGEKTEDCTPKDHNVKSEPKNPNDCINCECKKITSFGDKNCGYVYDGCGKNINLGSCSGTKYICKEEIAKWGLTDIKVQRVYRKDSYCKDNKCVSVTTTANDQGTPVDKPSETLVEDCGQCGSCMPSSCADSTECDKGQRCDTDLKTCINCDEEEEDCNKEKGEYYYGVDDSDGECYADSGDGSGDFSGGDGGGSDFGTGTLKSPYESTSELKCSNKQEWSSCSGPEERLCNGCCPKLPSSWVCLPVGAESTGSKAQNLENSANLKCIKKFEPAPSGCIDQGCKLGQNDEVDRDKAIEEMKKISDELWKKGDYYENGINTQLLVSNANFNDIQEIYTLYFKLLSISLSLTQKNNMEKIPIKNKDGTNYFYVNPIRVSEMVYNNYFLRSDPEKGMLKDTHSNIWVVTEQIYEKSEDFTGAIRFISDTGNYVNIDKGKMYLLLSNLYTNLITKNIQYSPYPFRLRGDPAITPNLQKLNYVMEYGKRARDYTSNDNDKKIMSMRQEMLKVKVLNMMYAAFANGLREVNSNNQFAPWEDENAWANAFKHLKDANTLAGEYWSYYISIPWNTCTFDPKAEKERSAEIVRVRSQMYKAGILGLIDILKNGKSLKEYSEMSDNEKLEFLAKIYNKDIKDPYLFKLKCMIEQTLGLTDTKKLIDDDYSDDYSDNFIFLPGTTGNQDSVYHGVTSQDQINYDLATSITPQFLAQSLNIALGWGFGIYGALGIETLLISGAYAKAGVTFASFVGVAGGFTLLHSTMENIDPNGVSADLVDLVAFIAVAYGFGKLNKMYFKPGPGPKEIIFSGKENMNKVLDGLRAKGAIVQDLGNDLFRITLNAEEVKIKFVNEDAIIPSDAKPVKPKVGCESDGKPCSTCKASETGGGCFLAGTQIQMADNSFKNIEDILKGEDVKAFDIGNKKAVNTEVTTTFARPENSHKIIEIETD